MRFVLIIVLSTLFCKISIAQNGYADGYYITFGLDTVHTKIEVNASKLGKKIGYINEKSKKKKFNANDNIEYGINGLPPYVSVAFVKKYHKARYFAKVVQDGQVRLMYYQFKKKYFIKKTNDLDAIKIKRWPFRWQMMKFFQDFDDLVEDIRTRKLKRRQIETIVRKYNNWYVEFYIPYLESLEREKR